MNKYKQELLNQFIQSLMRVRRIAEQSFTVSTKDKMMTILQRQALQYLKEYPETTVGELATELGLSSSAIAQLINRLMYFDFIGKKIDKSDHRIIHLNITKNGVLQLETSHRTLVGKVGKVFSNMEEKDLKEVVRIFTNFLKKIEK